MKFFGVLLFALGGLAFMLMGSITAMWGLDSLVARQLEIVDDAGRVVLVLSGDCKYGFIRVLDERGGDILNIGPDPYSEGGSIIIRNRQGQGVCTIGVDATQQDGTLVLRDFQLEKRVVLRAAQ